MNESENFVWVFHGANGRFTSGVFSTLDNAEQWIDKYHLSGVLTKYPLDISAYDWALANELYDEKAGQSNNPDFIQKFTSASQEHFHYENGEREA